MPQVAPASAWRAIGMRPGSGAKARNTIRPIVDRRLDDQAVGGGYVFFLGKRGVLLGRHEIELDGVPTGGAVVDRVIGDALARIEGDRRIGLAHRRNELERAAGQVIAAYRGGKCRIHERHDRGLGGRRRKRHHGVDRRQRRQPRIGILRRGLRHRQHGRQMHDAAEQDGGENPQQGADHEQPFRTIAGIGPSLVVRVATPIGVS